jgi:HEAT repeat protein
VARRTSSRPCSALCEAVGERDTKVLELLLAAGAKPDRSAMWQAGWLNKVEALKLLLAAKGDPSDALPGAGQGGHVALVKLLLEKGADPKSKAGEQALHGAALQGGLETVQLLLKAGADPNVADERGETPLHMAISGDANLKIVQALVEAGAKLSATDNQGLTPVRLAANRNAKEIYQWLLARSGGKEPRPSSDRESAAAKKSTAELIEDLQSNDSAAEQQAVRELASRGKEIMPEVLKAIDEGARMEKFLKLFTTMGPDADAALPKVKELLGDERTAFAAAVMLERMRPGGFYELPAAERQEAAQTLYDSIADENANEMAGYSASMLAAMGEISSSHFVKLLKSGKPKQQRYAISGLEHARFDDPQIQAELIRIAGDPASGRLRRDAARTLGRFGKPTEEVKAVLLEILREPPPERPPLDAGRSAYEEWKQRTDAAARSLARFGPEVIDELLPLLTPLDTLGRLPAMTALQSLGPPAIPRLIELLGHEDEAIATSASVALNRMGREAVEPLAKALDSDNDQVTIQAASALWWMGGGAKWALPRLLGVAESEKRSDAARVATARAALKVNPESREFKPVLMTIPCLIRLLNAGTFRQQAEAAETLGMIGPAAREALPALRKRLEAAEEDVDTQGLVRDYVRRQAREAIEAIESDARSQE